jgi:hypothetical protein
MKTNKRNNKRFRKTKKHRMVGGVSVMESGYVFDGVKRGYYEEICNKRETINPDAKSFDNEEFKVTYHKNDIYDNFVGRYVNHPEYDSDPKRKYLVKKGTLTFKNGDVYEGILSNFSYRDVMGDKNGKMTYANGIVYEGEWWNGERKGKGKLMDTHGNVLYDGNWEKDKAIDILPLQYLAADASYKQIGNKEVSYEEFKNFVEELGPQYDVLDKLGYQGRCKLINNTHLTGNITGGKNKKSKRNKKYCKSCKNRHFNCPKV